ncbi:GNAT family N-acetyltransferase [Saccharibacillus qingshengii]|uniref:GNAT family N-acetyltransferase n=1 Tax=Saccharibacillus qingshengii TaxID=1763540 RepID=UPI001552DB60|nr:GNAT family N-acetyltransferase [Saccharibacillus qingshengii]
MQPTASAYSIRHFRESDFPALGAFYNQTAERRRVTFWWVGDPENWPNVYCAFEDDKIIAKGQVDVFSTMPPTAKPSSKHRIFFNLKTLPERETDTNLLGAMYEVLHARALELKALLPDTHGTLLGFGNYAEEAANTGYFTSRPEFSPLKRQYRMCHTFAERRSPDADATVGTEGSTNAFPLPDGYTWREYDVLSSELADDYLALDMEIWPETPIGADRLGDLSSRSGWRMLQIHADGKAAASLMYWVSDGETGEIEEVLTRSKHRRRGLASALLNRALSEIRSRGCADAELDVEALNEDALRVYQAAGFEIETEEQRYAVEL